MASELASSGDNDPAALAASRTRVMTSSSGNSVDALTFGSREPSSQVAGVTLLRTAGAAKSHVTKETSASGAAAAAGESSSPEIVSARSFCGLNGGILAERSDTVSERLPETRTYGRTRTTSRSWVLEVVGMRTIWRATPVGSLTAGRRSVLRIAPRRSPMPVNAPRNAVSRRSGASAKLVSPSSEAKTAPPIRAAPHSPVSIVPLNHCTESRRRSTRPPVPPSTRSGGSLPRSMVSVSSLRVAPRSLPWSKTTSPALALARGVAPCSAEVRRSVPTGPA